MKYLYFLGFLLLMHFSVQCQDDIVGMWDKSDGKGKMEIYRSKDGKYFGKLITVADRFYKNGKPPIDHRNPSPTLATRPVIGINSITNLAYVSKNKWENGTIYDPERGKYFPCNAWLEDNGNTLKVMGHWGILYETHTWNRVK